MTYEKFNESVKEQLDYCEQLLTSKGQEYSLTTDRLDSFKMAAAVQDNTPAQALGGMLAKHIVSIYSMINAGSNNKDKYKEKITDAINYLLILKAMVDAGEDAYNR